MNSKNWMRKNHLEDTTRKDRLARDIRADEKFPSNGDGKFEGWHALMLSTLFHPITMKSHGGLRGDQR